ILEGKADLKTKEVGYANELVKALYNLESFYATGREIGFNTMLLCEEKITKDNQLLDYMSTAKYLNRSMIKPSRASLLATFIHSHPPSYYRIAALLGNKLKPGKEAILPFICLKRSNQKKYAMKFEKVREKFKIIAKEKFKEYFEIKNISLLMEKLRRKELYQFDIEKSYIFKNLITDEIIIGQLKDIHFVDDITNPDQYVILDSKTTQKNYLNSSLYSRTQYDLKEQYFLNKKMPISLINIKLDETNKDGHYLFLDKDNNEIQKPIRNSKLPNSILFIKSLKDHEIFFKVRGDLRIFKCINVIPANKLDNFKLEMIDYENRATETIEYSLSELIIRPKKIYLSISKSSNFRESEVNILNWLLKKNLQSFIYLKKPVNNLEIGYIQGIKVFSQSFKNSPLYEMNKEGDRITIKNIFGNEIQIPYNKLELINFEYNSAMIQKKSSTSFSSRLGYKILKKFKPDRIIMS
ncbi:MAG: hypothetical protein KAT57_06970, partial [Candidatus Lokiarchaeota archaeon]|nr:hypothetical protein [Candidatus Lokiarchaeota archaeon]